MYLSFFVYAILTKGGMDMVEQTSVSLNSISELDFHTLNHQFTEDHSVSEFVQFWYPKAQGIFYNTSPIGLFQLEPFIDENLAISLALLQSYRRKGIATIVRNRIVLEYGKKYPNMKWFICNIVPRNVVAYKSIAFSDWVQTHIYDELMINEGADFFYIYYKENPYYKGKEKIKI